MNSKTKHRSILVFVLLLLCVRWGYGEIRLPHLISDGMVLQRDRDIRVWGWADAKEPVAITFNGRTYRAITGYDKKWRFVLPAMPAGGPYEMVVKGTNQVTIKDILVGDVWLCSGQSNMEFEMARAKDKYADIIANADNPRIRQFMVRRGWSFTPKEDTGPGEWKAADSITVLKFTAVGYFFARELYARYHVPVGLINSSVGGTPAEAWTSEEGLQQLPQYIDELAPYKDSMYVKAILDKNKQLSEDWYKKVKQLDLGSAGQPADRSLQELTAWASPDLETSSWNHLSIPGSWAGQGIKNAAGITWLRKEIDIPAVMAGKSGVLFLGNISDQDSTWFNGVKVGAVNSRYFPRIYTVPAALVKPGRNVIVIRVLNLSGNGEFYKGKPYRFEIDSTAIDLSGEWKYATGISVEPFPSTQIVNLSYQPTSLFNSMIAPLLPFTLKGVIWYQGEANTNKAYDYRALFAALITDWRKQFDNSALPFLFVQLANLGAPPRQPDNSTWAELREAQAMALRLPNTGMAVTHDIGEWNDIHPLDKLDVGRRLALAAEKLAYGDKKVVFSGPVYRSMSIKGKEIVLEFDNIGSGLMIKDGGKLQQFAIAGSDRKFVWANARIEGDKVVVWSEDVSDPAAVRYAWANNPEGANLYNREGLP
ncbi:MAG TPA: sialate O-acetylesterase, partial [Puia sp.]